MCLLLYPVVFCLELLSLSPLLLALLMPLYGSVFGTLPALRLSLILIFYAVCTALLSKQLGALGPLMSGLALAMASTIQFVILPNLILYCFEIILWLLEPCLQLVEVIMIVTTTMKTSTLLMEFDDERPPLGKAAIIVATMTSFTVTAIVLCLFALQADDLFWMVYVVGIVYLLTAVATVWKDEGIISDAAVVCLASALVLSIAQWERSHLDNVQEIGSTNAHLPSSDDQSLVSLILSMPRVSLELANQPVQFFRSIFSLPFWFMAGLRVLSAIWFVIWMRQPTKDYEDSFDFEDSDEEGCFSYYLVKSTRRLLQSNSTLAQILAAIFVYTQIVTIHLGRSFALSSSSTEVSILTKLIHLVPTGGIRFIQCFAVISLYLWRLANPLDRDGIEMDW